MQVPGDCTRVTPLLPFAFDADTEGVFARRLSQTILAQVVKCADPRAHAHILSRFIDRQGSAVFRLKRKRDQALALLLFPPDDKTPEASPAAGLLRSLAIDVLLKRDERISND